MELTQKILNDAGPAGFRINSGDVYIMEDLVFRHGVGNAISNDAVGGSIRIFGQGHRLINLPGGGPWNETMAEGVNILASQVYIDNLNVGVGSELGKFRVGIRLGTYQDALGNPLYATTPGNHFLSQLQVSAWYYGIQTMGANCTYIQVYVGDTGGGALQAKPIGIDHWGAGAKINNCYIHNMIKGAQDLETMHMHLGDAHDGSIGSITLANDVSNPLSFGIWFNSTNSFNGSDMVLQNIETCFSGDLAAGRLDGVMSGCKTKSTLPLGPIVHLVNRK